MFRNYTLTLYCCEELHVKVILIGSTCRMVMLLTQIVKSLERYVMLMISGKRKVKFSIFRIIRLSSIDAKAISYKFTILETKLPSVWKLGEVLFWVEAVSINHENKNYRTINLICLHICFLVFLFSNRTLIAWFDSIVLWIMFPSKKWYEYVSAYLLFHVWEQ